VIAMHAEHAIPVAPEEASAEELEREEVLVAIEQEKVELRRALDDLQEAVVAEPKRQLERYAIGILVGGFVAGILLAMLTAPAPAPRIVLD
jgi:hypothetical protein